jgi:hypothetical protein
MSTLHSHAVQDIVILKPGLANALGIFIFRGRPFIDICRRAIK